MTGLSGGGGACAALTLSANARMLVRRGFADIGTKPKYSQTPLICYPMRRFAASASPVRPSPYNAKEAGSGVALVTGGVGVTVLCTP